MQLRWIIGPTVMLLVGCADHRAESRVKEMLNDPGSAQFSDVSSADGVTCGFVNAKNRIGGYVGPQLFIVSGDLVRIFDKVDASAINMANLCDYPVQHRLQRIVRSEGANLDRAVRSALDNLAASNGT